MKTIFVKPKDVERKWWLVDAEGQTLGRLASRITTVLRGKHKPIYSPHMETGDYVVVVNAEKVKITGNKREQKVYYRHSGYPGGLKTEVLGKLMITKPTFALEHAIKGMLPRGKMGRKIFKNVKIYAGAEHPHGAQKPETLQL
jgi:large subunit ribosomal protein L13